MNDLADVAQRLRIVREAHRRFLKLYAMEVAVIEPALDRVAEDVMASDPDSDAWFPPADAGDDLGSAPLGW
jgi:hypothetical protein